MNVTLPYPPSSNEYWKPAVLRSGRPGIVPTELAEAYKAAIRTLLEPLIRDVLFVAGRDVTLVVAVFRPRNSGDLGNRLKVLEDALNRVVYDDDRQIARIEIERWRADDDVGSVDVSVREHVPRAAPPRPALSPSYAARLKLAIAAVEAVRARTKARKRAKAEAREAAKGTARKVWQQAPPWKRRRIRATPATYRPGGKR